MPAPKKPISAKRLAANRANAARSTGPRTPQGKARSAANSRHHRFWPDQFAVVRLEEAGALDKIRADLIARYQPFDSQELFALERMALAQQSILRYAYLESGFLTCCINQAVDPSGDPVYLLQPDLTRDIPVTSAQNRNYLLAEGFLREAQRSNAIALLFRYQVQADRMFRRALEEFDRLKALRHEIPDEPIEESQPEETAPVPEAPANPSEPRKPLFVPLQRPVPVDPTVAITSPNPPGFRGRDGRT